MKRNNRLGDHSAYPMPPRYTGGSKNFSVLRRIDGHAPLSVSDTDDDSPIVNCADQNATYPYATDYEYPLTAEEASFDEDTL